MAEEHQLSNDIDPASGLEKAVEPYKLELKSLRDQNKDLITTLQDYKLQLNSSKKKNLELCQNELKLKSELNWCKTELNRSHSVINGLEKTINESFSRLLKISKPLSHSKLLLKKVSTSEFGHFKAKKFNGNSLPRENGSKSGSQTMHWVSPMVEGLPISKPTIKLQRVTIPSQPCIENEKTPSSHAPTAAVPKCLVSSAAEEPAALGGPEVSVDSESICEPALPISNTPSIPERKPSISIPETVVDKVRSGMANSYSYLQDLDENLELIFKLLTEETENLVHGKEAINKFYSTPAPEVASFNSSEESTLECSPTEATHVVVTQKKESESADHNLSIIEEENKLECVAQNVSEVNMDINNSEGGMVLKRRVNRKNSNSTLQNTEAREKPDSNDTVQTAHNNLTLLQEEETSDKEVEMSVESVEDHCSKPIPKQQKVVQADKSGKEAKASSVTKKSRTRSRKGQKLEEKVQAEQEVPETKRLRKRAPVTYKEPSINMKLRRK